MDLISRKALLGGIQTSVEPFTVSMVYRHINNAPAVDAVPVVRCKDCKHAVEIEKNYIKKLFIDGTKECDIGRGDLYYGASIVSDDGFCDSGERRADMREAEHV